MNIFVLDNDMKTNVHYHIDKHIVKMPLEAAQMLCTNEVIFELCGHVAGALNKAQLQLLREYSAEMRPEKIEHRFMPYLPVSPNHPCTIWARTSLENTYWLRDYLYLLSMEHMSRYSHTKPNRSFEHIIGAELDLRGVSSKLTPHPQAMKQYPHCMGPDTVLAYRKFYVEDKHTFASWKHGQVPTWWLNIYKQTFGKEYETTI